jgi:cellulose 1,4-beta-cellobiosidase
MARLFCTGILLGFAHAQQAGTAKLEQHLPLPVQKCAKGSCVAEHGEVTLDANWRWIHGAQGYQNCYTGTSWDASLCPDPKSCSENCAIDGVDTDSFRNTYGVTARDSGVSLGFVTGSNVGSRLYVLENETTYKLFKLKNREFSMELDVSSLECGINGASYFVEMPADGGLNELNKAGAKFGTGYCDAQCPHDVKFIDGLANIKNWDNQKAKGEYGSCCAELDIWEANNAATAYTVHPCSLNGPERCDGLACGDGGGWTTGHRYDGVCDADGCDFNAYRMGNASFFGKGASFAVDTSRPFSVVTQFLTTDGTDAGDLSEIRRIYVQDGREIPNAESKIRGVTGGSITDKLCAEQKQAFSDVNDFAKKGALKQMGEAMDRGMVLVLSLWDDTASNMLWLDSSYPSDKPASTPGVTRGPCSTSSGVPSEVRSKYPNAMVKYMNIKYGEIGSTIHSAPAPVPPPSPAPTPPSPSPSPSPGPATGGNCCWGAPGFTCDSPSKTCQGGWCGESKDHCTGSCSGTWCPKVSAFTGESAVVV